MCAFKGSACAFKRRSGSSDPVSRQNMGVACSTKVRITITVDGLRPPFLMLMVSLTARVISDLILSIMDAATRSVCRQLGTHSYSLRHALLACVNVCTGCSRC
jgi:hypothetical protein